MAEKHIEMMRKKTDGTFDIYYPKTKAELIIMPGGGDLAHDYVRSPGYGTAIGTNDKTITLNPAPAAYVEGMAISFKNQTQNTGAVTLNVNGLGAKSVLKPNGNALASGNLKANSVYTVRYNGTNFILQGEGGEYGTAGAAQVLTGYTIGTESGIVSGTMPNRAGDTAALSSVVAGTTLKLLASQGYRDGVDDYVTITDADFVAANIRNGKNIFGVVGTLVEGKRWASGSVTGDANANITISGLAFAPAFVILYQNASHGTYRSIVFAVVKGATDVWYDTGFADADGLYASKTSSSTGFYPVGDLNVTWGSNSVTIVGFAGVSYKYYVFE